MNRDPGMIRVDPRRIDVELKGLDSEGNEGTSHNFTKNCHSKWADATLPTSNPLGAS